MKQGKNEIANYELHHRKNETGGNKKKEVKKEDRKNMVPKHLAAVAN